MMSIEYNILIITDIILLSMLLVIATSVSLFRSLVINAVMMCTFSLLMALIYLTMGAPDVAITEASVGACLSTVFMLSALTLIRKKKASVSKNHLLPLICSILLFFSLIHLITDFPKFGYYNLATNDHLPPFYINKTQEVIDIPNVVTTILADFRGYDTLCETIVIFTSALGISLLLNQKNKGHHD